MHAICKVTAHSGLQYVLLKSGEACKMHRWDAQPHWFGKFDAPSPFLIEVAKLIEEEEKNGRIKG